MSQKNIALAGLVLGMEKTVELPERLRNFLTMDGMDGINDFNFMLTNSKLCRKIPGDVRTEYEILYAQLSTELDEICYNLEKQLSEIRSNPKEIIHEMIQHSLEDQNAK